MKRALFVLIAGCVATFCASAALADTSQNGEAAIAVHITSQVTKLPCDNAPVLTAKTVTECAVGNPGDFFSVWLIVCNVSDSLGVAGLEYGIGYDGMELSGLDVTAWVSCTDLEFPMTGWPAAGTGNLQTWDYTTNCQNTLSEPYVPRTVIAVAGVFQVTYWGPDQFLITPRPASGRAKIGDCFGAELDITDYVPSHLGIGGFCLPGWNPCGAPTAVEPSTWGKIKQQY